MTDQYNRADFDFRSLAGRVFSSWLVVITLVLLLVLSISFRAVAEDSSIDEIENLNISNLEEIDLEEIIDELLHIRRIDSDLSRLMAYDDFVDELREKVELAEERKEGIVAEYKGEDDKITALYELEAPWEVHWESTGRIFQLYVYDEDDRRVEVAANKTRGGSGIYENSSSGSYYLEISAVGKWNLTIKEAIDD